MPLGIQRHVRSIVVEQVELEVDARERVTTNGIRRVGIRNAGYRLGAALLPAMQDQVKVK